VQVRRVLADIYGDHSLECITDPPYLLFTLIQRVENKGLFMSFEFVCTTCFAVIT
jgi:hypothetical protein